MNHVDRKRALEVMHDDKIAAAAFYAVHHEETAEDVRFVFLLSDFEVECVDAMIADDGGAKLRALFERLSGVKLHDWKGVRDAGGRADAE